MSPHCSTGVPGSSSLPSPPLVVVPLVSPANEDNSILNSRVLPLPLRIREQPMRVSIGLVTHTQCRGGGGQVLLVDGGRRMESEWKATCQGLMKLSSLKFNQRPPSHSVSFPLIPRGDPVSLLPPPPVPFLQGFKLRNSL